MPAAHNGCVIGSNPDPSARGDRDHRRSRTCSTHARTATIDAGILTVIRRSLPTTITICPTRRQWQQPRRLGLSGKDDPYKAGLQRFEASYLGPNARRHVISNERDIHGVLLSTISPLALQKLSVLIRNIVIRPATPALVINTLQPFKLRTAAYRSSAGTVTHQLD